MSPLFFLLILGIITLDGLLWAACCCFLLTAALRRLIFCFTGAFAADAPNGSSHNKKSKKKKTFAELREEEDLLLKERVTLKRELASLHVTFKEQKARSENLKRFKIDLNLQTSGGEVCGATGDRQVVGPRNKCSQMEVSTCDHAHSSASSRGVEKDVDLQRRSCFVLPDLNMTPSEEDFGPEVLHASR